MTLWELMHGGDVCFEKRLYVQLDDFKSTILVVCTCSRTLVYNNCLIDSC